MTSEGKSLLSCGVLKERKNLKESKQSGRGWCRERDPGEGRGKAKERGTDLSRSKCGRSLQSL